MMPREELVLTSPAQHPPGESDEFYTLRRDFDPWNEEFRFTVDCCALNAEAAKLPRFYSPEDDGLKQDYAGERVWMKPPFSALVPWMELAHSWMTTLYSSRQARLWVALLPQNRQEQDWWQRLVEPYRDLPRAKERDETGRVVDARLHRHFIVETRNIRGRRRFGFPGSPDDPTGGKQPMTGHLLVIWRAV